MYQMLLVNQPINTFCQKMIFLFEYISDLIFVIRNTTHR